MTQGQFAALIPKAGGKPGHVNRTTVANWEAGKHFPSRYQGAVESVLGISLSGEQDPVLISDGLRQVIAGLTPGERAWVMSELRQEEGRRASGQSSVSSTPDREQHPRAG